MHEPAMFPKAGAGQKGWPWDGSPAEMTGGLPAGHAWPKISVITPNYNYGHYLEETIRSVLLQGYPNLEYIVIDGGSTDESLAVIRKYEPWIAHWESEKDRGQSHAINKGFSRATGDLLMWINSDDVLLPGALQSMAEAYETKQEKLLFANVINFHDDGREEEVIQAGIRLENFIGIPEKEFTWHQPGMAVPRSFYHAVGGLDEDLHYIFDWEWVCRLLIHQQAVTLVDAFVTRFRVHDASKTGPGLMECWKELPPVLLKYNDYLPDTPARKVVAYYRLKVASLCFCAHPGSPHYWNRLEGIKSLLGAFRVDPSIAMETRFIRLLIRALLPRCLYRSK